MLASPVLAICAVYHPAPATMPRPVNRDINDISNLVLRVRIISYLSQMTLNKRRCCRCYSAADLTIRGPGTGPDFAALAASELRKSVRMPAPRSAEGIGRPKK